MNWCLGRAVLVVSGMALAVPNVIAAQIVDAAADRDGAAAVAGGASPPAFEPPDGYAGPPAPVAPAVVTRDAEGRAAVRAVRLTQPLRIDGQLDEALYRDVLPISDFIQMEPK